MSRGRLVWPVMVAVVICQGCAAPRGAGPTRAHGALELGSGDLIFLDLDCGALCEAMERVTAEQFKVAGPDLSHVGLVERTGAGEVMILEAWPSGGADDSAGVVRTPLVTVLSRVKGGLNEVHGFRVGRLARRHRSLGERVVQAARALLGAPYDPLFLQGNGRYYCSELIYLAFKEANHGRPVFSLSPMFFGAPGTEAHRIWQRYYRELGRDAPEGEPGLSPLGVYLHGREHLFQGDQ